jgi:hypothetical protein
MGKKFSAEVPEQGIENVRQFQIQFPLTHIIKKLSKTDP